MKHELEISEQGVTVDVCVRACARARARALELNN